MSASATDSRVRRVARRAGLHARKSRWRAGSIDNMGGYQLIDPWANHIVAGERFDLDGDAVLEFCEGAAS